MGISGNNRRLAIKISCNCSLAAALIPTITSMLTNNVYLPLNALTLVTHGRIELVAIRFYYIRCNTLLFCNLCSIKIAWTVDSEAKIWVSFIHRCKVKRTMDQTKRHRCRRNLEFWLGRAISIKITAVDDKRFGVEKQGTFSTKIH